MKYSRGTLSDFIEFNPRESLPKGNVAKEIAMADLIPFQKKSPTITFRHIKAV